MILQVHSKGLQTSMLRRKREQERSRRAFETTKQREDRLIKLK